MSFFYLTIKRSFLRVARLARQKHTLRVELDFLVLEVGESFAQVVEERVLLFGFHDSVVHVDLDVASDLLSEAVLHHALVCCTHVLEPRGHTCVAVDTVGCYEGCVVFVFFSHPYLVVA